MKIITVKIENRISESLFERLYQCMQPVKQRRCKRFRRIEDSERLLVADVLVRHYLCFEFGYKNHELRFDTNEYEKPFFINDPGICFNVSHSGQWVAAAFDRRDVGVDIQKVGPVKMDIAKRYFTGKEYQTLLQKNGDERTAYFYTLWTLKESCMKAVGRGLSLGLDRFSFSVRDGVIACDTETEYKGFQFKAPEIDSGYKLAVCFSLESAFETMTRIHLEQIEESGILFS